MNKETLEIETAETLDKDKAVPKMPEVTREALSEAADSTGAWKARVWSVTSKPSSQGLLGSLTSESPESSTTAGHWNLAPSCSAMRSAR